MILNLRNACWQTSKGRRQKADHDSLLNAFLQFLPQLWGQKEKITWILLTTEGQRVVKITPAPFPVLSILKTSCDKRNSGITVTRLRDSTMYDQLWLAGKEEKTETVHDTLLLYDIDGSALCFKVLFYHQYTVFRWRWKFLIPFWWEKVLQKCA